MCVIVVRLCHQPTDIQTDSLTVARSVMLLLTELSLIFYKFRKVVDECWQAKETNALATSILSTQSQNQLVEIADTFNDTTTSCRALLGTAWVIHLSALSCAVRIINKALDDNDGSGDAALNECEAKREMQNNNFQAEAPASP